MEPSATGGERKCKGFLVARSRFTTRAWSMVKAATRPRTLLVWLLVLVIDFSMLPETTTVRTAWKRWNSLGMRISPKRKWDMFDIARSSDGKLIAYSAYRPIPDVTLLVSVMAIHYRVAEGWWAPTTLIEGVFADWTPVTDWGTRSEEQATGWLLVCDELEKVGEEYARLAAQFIRTNRKTTSTPLYSGYVHNLCAAIAAAAAVTSGFRLLLAAPAFLASRRLPRPGLCNACGYDLRGLRSGICPECGASTP